MRNFGFSGVDNVIFPGTNGKMPEISAAMGLANLQSIDRFIEHARYIYQAYQKALADISEVKLLEYDEKESNNYQDIVVQVSKDANVSRDQIINVLQAENVLARRYFWPGCHRMMPYRKLNPDAGRFLKQSEDVAESIIVLPTGMSVDHSMVNTITSIIRVLLKYQQ